MVVTDGLPVIVAVAVGEAEGVHEVVAEVLRDTVTVLVTVAELDTVGLTDCVKVTVLVTVAELDTDTVVVTLDEVVNVGDAVGDKLVEVD